MSNQHTPEPWTGHFSKHHGCVTISGTNRYAATVQIYQTPRMMGEIEEPEREANAARIVACVNALAGVADPAETLKAVREALEEVIGCFDAAETEDIEQVIRDSTDERLVDLVTRRLAFAKPAAQRALALLPATTEAQKS